jgi:hypothetical protein
MMMRTTPTDISVYWKFKMAASKLELLICRVVGQTEAKCQTALHIFEIVQLSANKTDSHSVVHHQGATACYYKHQGATACYYKHQGATACYYKQLLNGNGEGAEYSELKRNMCAQQQLMLSCLVCIFNWLFCFHLHAMSLIEVESRRFSGWATERESDLTSRT